MEKLKKYDKILLIIILILQIIAIIYASSKREYPHIDEFYSHGLMQYKRAFIFENDDFKNNWHPSEYFKQYLTITNENKLDFSAVYKNQMEDVHPPIWYLLLRIACMFNINNFSLWPGTILNIILFIFSSIMLYLIGKNIFGNKYYALLLCLLNGFSIGTIETVIFVRMYQLFVLNVLILIYWHMKRDNIEDIKIKKDLIPLYFMIIIGFLTHYYYSIIVVILYLIYAFKLIKKKKYDSLFKYTATLIFSVLTSLIIWPYSIKHIFFGYRGQQTFFNASRLFSEYFISSLQVYAKIINSELLNGQIYTLIAIIIISVIILVIKKVGLKKELELEKNKNKLIKYITIPIIIYSFIAILTSPYADIRYIMPIIPLINCFIIYILNILLKDVLPKKVAFCTILLLIIIFSFMTVPKLSNNLFTFKEFNEITKTNILDNKSVIYVYSDLTAQYNKIMSIYNILLYSKETYILPEDEVNSEKIIEILKDKDLSDGIILLVNEDDFERCFIEMKKSNLFTEYEYAGKYILNGFCTFLFK